MDLDQFKHTWQKQNLAEEKQYVIQKQEVMNSIKKQMGPLERMASTKQAIGGMITPIVFGGLYLAANFYRGAQVWETLPMIILMVTVIGINARDYWYLRRIESQAGLSAFAYLEQALSRIKFYRQRVWRITLVTSGVGLAFLGLLVYMVLVGHTWGEMKLLVGVTSFLGFFALISSVLTKYYYLAELQRYEQMEKKIKFTLNSWKLEEEGV